jgi:hypothetical protein
LAFISLTSIYLSIHLGNLFIGLGRDIIESCRKKYSKRKATNKKPAETELADKESTEKKAK